MNLRLLFSVFTSLLIFSCSTNEKTKEKNDTDVVNPSPKDSVKSSRPVSDIIIQEPEVISQDTIVILSQNGEGWKLIPVSKKDFDNTPQPTELELVKYDDARVFESDDEGEFSSSQNYLGTFPKSGIHIYAFSGYEDGGFRIYDKDYELTGNQVSQFSEQPVEDPSGNYILQNLSSMDFLPGILMYNISEGEATDQVYFDKMKLKDLRVNDSGQILIKAEQFVDEFVEVHYLITSKELPKYDVLLDPRDSNSYDIVRMNKMWWMNEPLRFDADSLDFADSLNPDAPRYYKLISQGVYQIELMKSLCPPGWRLPTISNWHSLFKDLGVPNIANGEEPIYAKNIIESGFHLPTTGMASFERDTLIFENDQFNPNGMNYSYYWFIWGDKPVYYRFDTHYCNNTLCGSTFFHFSEQPSTKDGLCVRCIKDFELD